MKKVICVVEDEKAINDLVNQYLKKEGYEVRSYYTYEEASAHVMDDDVHLWILDIMLDDKSGFDLIEEIRLQGKDIPVIFMSARDKEFDRIIGLEKGSDDYITKPFSPSEMVARVKAQLRRYKRYNGEFLQKEPLTCGGLVIDVEAHQASLNGAPLSLTPTEFSLLAVLCENKGKVVSSEELFRRVWGEGYYTKDNNTITVHIRHLREKLGDSFERPKYIKTVWGVGYEMDA